MPDVKVPLALPGGDVNFNFSFPMEVAAGKPFPEAALSNGPISLVSVKAKADKDFKIGDAVKSISFGAGGEGLAGLGVYRKAADLLKDLKSEGFEESVANLKNFKIGAADNLLALRWGYGLEGNAKGQVAFAPGGSLTFGADARHAAVSAVLHARPQSENAIDSIAKTLAAWKAPGQVKIAKDLPAKTSLITETTGRLGLSVGLQYGYSYNWVKEGLEIGGLKGDLGVKIEAGVSARLGFTAEGRYALALTRESSANQLRVQVFRLRQRGWGFAFHAGVSGQAKAPVIPKSFDEFIKGVFNLHGLQVIKDIEMWLDTDRKLADLLGEAAVNEGAEMFKKITGFDPIQEAEKFAEKIQGFIDKWNELPTEVPALVYGWLDTTTAKTNIKPLRTFLEKLVQSAGSSQAIAKEITSQMKELDFFENPIGKWLSAAAEKEVLSLLANIDDERAKVVDYAKKTLGFLDGSELSKMLKRLQEGINEKIGLDKLEKALATDIDAWLIKRLSDFLGDIDVIKKLDEIRATIERMRARWEVFYDEGVKALTQKYNFDLNYAFQTSSTSEALIDLTIDFADAKAPTHLENVLKGEFAEILQDTVPGITLNSAVLTHGIKRNTHLEIDSSFFKMGLDQINDSFAEGKGVDTADGRLWAFSLRSVDIKERKDTLSKLSISAQVATKKGNIRVFDTEAYEANYKYMLAEKKASARFVERRLELGVDSYLRSSFPSGNSFSDYLIDIDKFLDKHNVEGVGNIVASLGVSIPGRALGAFKNLPIERNHSVYRDISSRVQTFLRRVVPNGYLFESRVFENHNAVLPLLAYASLPLMPALNVAEAMEPRVFFWDFKDRDERVRVLTSSNFRASLLATLRRYRPDIPQSAAHHYEDGDVDSIIHAILAPGSSQSGSFVGICDLEYSILRGVASCAKFLDTVLHSDDRADQIKALAKFGSEFTETFNEDLGGDYAGKSLRPLGGLLIIEIAKALDPTLPTLTPTAMLETMVVKPEVKFDPDKIIDGTLPKETELLFHQRIVGGG
jgi:hypothetical protein